MQTTFPCEKVVVQVLLNFSRSASFRVYGLTNIDYIFCCYRKQMVKILKTAVHIQTEKKGGSSFCHKKINIYVNASSRNGTLGTHPSLHSPKWESLENVSESFEYFISQTFQLFLQQECIIFNPFLCILGNSPHLMCKRFHCYLMHSHI